MPIASVRMTIAEKLRFRLMTRIAWRKSAARPLFQSLRLGPAAADAWRDRQPRSPGAPCAPSSASTTASASAARVAAAERDAVEIVEVFGDLVDRFAMRRGRDAFGGQPLTKTRSSPDLCMFQPRGFRQRIDERRPPAALRGQGPAALSGELVIAPPPLAGLLDPSALDPLAILELVEEGIERGDVKGQQSVRFSRDLARDVVAVELAVVERARIRSSALPLRAADSSNGSPICGNDTYQTSDLKSATFKASRPQALTSLTSGGSSAAGHHPGARETYWCCGLPRLRGR